MHGASLGWKAHLPAASLLFKGCLFEREREGCPPFPCTFLKWPQQPGGGQAEAMTWELRTAASRFEMDQLGLEQGCTHHKPWLYPPWHRSCRTSCVLAHASRETWLGLGLPLLLQSGRLHTPQLPRHTVFLTAALGQAPQAAGGCPDLDLWCLFWVMPEHPPVCFYQSPSPMLSQGVGPQRPHGGWDHRRSRGEKRP